MTQAQSADPTHPADTAHPADGVGSVALDGGGTLTAVEAAEAARRAAEVSVLHLAAHWADLHGDHEGVTRAHGKTDEAGQEREHPRFRRVGGVGTPVVDEFAPAELGVSLRKHPWAARALLADALDLRHRLGPLWELTFTGAPVEVWLLRKVAARTRHLAEQDAALVAEDLVTVLVSLPPRRLLERLDALVLLADAAADETERQAHKRHRFARFHSSDQRGLKGLYAKLAAPEAIVGDAQVHRLAELLLARDEAAGIPRAELDSIQVARSRALGLMLTDPATAHELLQADSPTSAGSAGPGSVRSGSGSRVRSLVHLHLSEHALQMLATPEASGTRHGGGVPRGVPGVGRLEGEGPVSLAEALEVLGLTEVTIRPVLDPAATAPTDNYAFTGTLREAVHVRTPADVYPFATCTTHHMDIDHTIAHQNPEPDQAGPPGGGTRLGNAGPMVRHHHRIKTHGPLAVRQPLPGIYIWQTRHHRYLMTDHRGTHHLDPDTGQGFFSHDPLQLGLSTTLLHHTLDLIEHDAA